jgi:hypothetical protein
MRIFCCGNGDTGATASPGYKQATNSTGQTSGGVEQWVHAGIVLSACRLWMLHTCACQIAFFQHSCSLSTQSCRLCCFVPQDATDLVARLRAFHHTAQSQPDKKNLSQCGLDLINGKVSAACQQAPAAAADCVLLVCVKSSVWSTAFLWKALTVVGMKYGCYVGGTWCMQQSRWSCRWTCEQQLACLLPLAYCRW